VEIKALVLCSDCEEPIMRNDARAADDARLICDQCVMSEIASDPSKRGLPGHAEPETAEPS
jgi:hypothetical protein